MREKHHSRQRTEVGAARLNLLTDIFTDVPPARRPEKVAATPSGKPKMWSSEEMESLVDFLVRITAQIQKSGCSELVDRVAETLHRTDGSCVNKLVDMKDKFLNKSTTVRAANIPDTIFDPASEAYKIFNADWKDHNDPYALGYIAMRARSHKLSAERRRKQRSKGIWSHRPKLRSVTKAASGTSSAPSQTNMSASAQPVADELHNQVHIAAPQTPPRQRTPANTLPANDYAAFVRDIAEQCQWAEKLVHSVLHCMQLSIELYRSNKLVDFFYQIASLTPGATFQDLFAHAQHILTQFEQRFGTLDGFENLALTADNNLPVATSDQETKEQDNPLNYEANEVSVATCTSAQSSPREKEETHSRSSEEGVADEDECDSDQFPVQSPGQQVSFTNKEDAVAGGDEGGHEHSSPIDSPSRTVLADNNHSVVDEDEQEHENSPLLESPSPTQTPQTPQTGNEDAADERSSSSTGKLSSPEGNWGDADGSDNESVGSSDNAWSSSSNDSDAKDTDRHAKDNPNPLNSNKPSKRGKDEQYGKSFDLAKKRRLDAKVPAIEDREDDDDDQSEEMDDDQLAEEDSMSSDGELEETPHPLQSILDSLDAHMADLHRKQRILIERKEDREFREPQHQYVDQEYSFFN
ncbi:hypothetical protein V7S43_001276 [Phytophthora oleae]|uniref:Myb-like domain-containing protein n=1 Tax=Phytophthora oleae TaxID=2107226 RepID=A0ABD3G6M4_9STRA